jgi:hypothetical protein
VRNISTDEAGTSAPEPVTLVVALLVHVDTQWLPAVRELRHLFGQVPAQYHEGFAFHAKWISAANKYPDWKEKDRTEFMCSVMNLPGTFNIPIALGGHEKRRVGLVRMGRKENDSREGRSLYGLH